ncbi:hypothetical protein V3C99_007171 [Haemonchus contortus]|nr:Protein C53D6.8 [Haemonchus contortus]
MEHMGLVLFLLPISVASWTPQMTESIDRTLMCACVLRDPIVPVNRRKPLTTTASPTTEVPESDEAPTIDEEQSTNFIPYKYWNFNRRNSERNKVQSESYMERFLSIFHHEPPTTTTPTLLMQEDSPPIFAPLAKLGQRIMDRYFYSLKSQWSFMDRFRCSCSGDLVNIPKAKTFITMKVVYD